MQITKIEPQARNNHKFNIFIDDQFALSLSGLQVTERRLKVGQELSDDDLSELKSASLFTKYYQKSLDYLAKRARSRQELKTYIIQKAASNQIIKKRDGQVIKLKAEIDRQQAELLAERIVEHLEQKKFINDADFALAWAKLKSAKSPSNKMLRQELSKKGISEDIIAQTIAKLNLEKSEGQALAELIVKLKPRSRYQDELKLKRYLVSKGFSYADIVAALATHHDEPQP